ncbi:hypothetical protein H1P_3750002 [Hyella patelloides LEGE 07179]|uniref:Uncharacterized protein n=1 Tax=Hyella patelloides LEGE 07179 TaxID=945734 RepID=A0A563VWN5_9CYAN|nr:DUF2839 family protein [Hyella patelloides]VEP15821.1 hypothetical protein H1P_3750002 [Hyella patelloides LEGE 07179]
MGKAKNRQPKTKNNSTIKTTKFFSWEISEFQKQKLIRWTIEGVIIGIISFIILWLPLFY